MSADWRDCIYRPHLCGQGDEQRAEGLRELLAELHGRPASSMRARWQRERPEALIPAAHGLPVRHGGFLLASYWHVVREPHAAAGDIVVVRGPGEYYILRRAKRADAWIEAPPELMVAGRVDRRLCVYGFVLLRDIERVAELVGAGTHALIAACDPRASARPPRREDMYAVWRQEGHLVNVSPARLAPVRLDPGARPRFAADYARHGCPAYSRHVNRLLALVGVPARLLC
jgi:hypothetical protein